MKSLTRQAVASRKEKAVRFVRDVLGDEDRANEIADESIDSYAERRGFTIINPERKNTMARKNSDMTKSELLDYVADLEDQLDAIASIANGDDEEDSNGDSDSDIADDAGDEDEDDED